MKNNDKSRKLMWWFLGAVVAAQLYFVRELFAAFALFVLAFAALASFVVVLYTLHHAWAFAVESVSASQHPLVQRTKQNVNNAEAFVRRGTAAAMAGAEELAKRTIRAGSATAR